MARRLSPSRKGHSIFYIEPKICFTRDENIRKRAGAGVNHCIIGCVVVVTKRRVKINNGLKGPPLRCGATLPRPDIEIFHFALCLQHK